MHLTIGDRLHPDSINLLLQTSLTPIPARDPLLLGKSDDRQADWLIVLSNLTLDEFKPVAMLRRLRPDPDAGAKTWRHFPVQPASHWDENHPEKLGCPIQFESLANLPTRNMAAVQAVATDLELPFIPKVEQLVDCLLCCAKFPFLTSLSVEIATIHSCLSLASPHTSWDLSQSLYKTQVILSVAGLAAPTRNELPLPPTERFPSAQVLLDLVDTTRRLVEKYAIQLGPAFALSDSFLRQLQLLYDGELCHMPDRHAQMIDKPENWAGREKVRLHLK
jgi:hypothetical protein